VNRLDAGGCGGRLSAIRDNKAPWHLQYKRKDCVSDDDSDDDSADGSTTSTRNRLPSNNNEGLVDCHVIIPWSELERLVNETMSCVECGLAVQRFEQQTVGIATEVDFFCPTCHSSKTAAALWSDHVEETTERKETGSR
jgi:hypothetical protein